MHTEGSPDVRAEDGKSPRAASKVFLEVEDGSLQHTGAADGSEHVPNGNATRSAFSNGGENEAGGEDGRGTSASASPSPYSNRQTTMWPSKSGAQCINCIIIV